jgi:hypothetical protein
MVYSHVIMLPRHLASPPLVAVWKRASDAAPTPMLPESGRVATSVIRATAGGRRGVRPRYLCEACCRTRTRQILLTTSSRAL